MRRAPAVSTTGTGNIKHWHRTSFGDQTRYLCELWCGHEQWAMGTAAQPPKEVRCTQCAILREKAKR